MSVNINVTGTASRQIVIANEQSAANIIAAVNTALTTMGWSLIDTVSSGANDMLVTKVYAAPNNDGPSPTTKYMIIRYEAGQQLWYVTACEHWNATTNVATNETFSNNGSFPLSLQQSNNVIYVFATARYAAFATAVRSELGPWQGVFEFEREALEDIAAKNTPCFGWTSALTIGEYYGSTNNSTGARPHMFWLPRAAAGYTGWAACQEFVITTAFGMYPPNATVIPFSSTGTFANGHNGMLGGFGIGMRYVWDAGKKIVSPLKLSGANLAYNVGRIYGLHVIPPTGQPLDTTQLPIDGNGFFSSSGTSAVHYILPITGGNIDDIGVGSNRLVQTPYNSGGPSTIRDMLVIGGRYVYVAASNGAWRLDLDTTLWTQLTVVNGSSDTRSVAFDGGIYLYFGSVSGLTRFNLTDETAETLAITGGVASVAVDDAYIYAGHRTSANQPQITVVDRATFSAQTVYTTPAPLNTHTHYLSLAVGYDGFVYARPQLITNQPLTWRVYKIEGSTGNSSFLDLSNQGGTSAGAVHGQALMYSVTTQTLFSAQSYFWSGGSVTFAVIQHISPSTLGSLHSNAWSTSGATGFIGDNSVQSTKIIPFKGYFWTAHQAAGTWSRWHHSAVDGSNTAVGSTPATSAVDTQSGLMMCTDGVAVYQASSGIQFARISGQAPVHNNAGNTTANILFRA